MIPRLQAKVLFAAVAVAIGNCGSMLRAQESGNERTSGGQRGSNGIYLPFAQFQIPFNVDSSGTPPAAFQLLVSTDDGATWQLHGRATPGERHFEFRAAAEGDYLFKIQSLDAAGVAFPSPDQPLRVRVDTSKPQAAIRADLDHSGNLIIDLRVFDDHLDLNSALIRVRTDRDSQWREVPVTTLNPVGQYYEGQVDILIPPCREVAVVFTVADYAKNVGEANLMYTVPRTAANASEMQLASTTAGVENTRPSGTAAGVNLPGAVSWDLPRDLASRFAQPPTTTTKPAMPLQNKATPSSLGGNPPFNPTGSQQAAAAAASQLGNFPTSPRISKPGEKNTGPGQLATSVLDLELSPPVAQLPEELALPTALPNGPQPADSLLLRSDARSQAVEKPAVDRAIVESAQSNDSPAASDELSENRMDLPYYCRSRTFSLDYSVEALGGNALSEVELWGSEDGGRTWQKWGSDPDRVSPFDVKVGNDGLFGFRMVLVGAGGTVLGNPKPGDDADAWIHVDTVLPNCKITRAVYGVGSEAGMLVIDYTCTDDDLSEQAISLSWSAMPDGPWTAVANGLKNTGLYLWKADPGLPNRVYLKLDAVDKAGNIGTHRLELPIDTKGLAPRGRIQGIRPIVAP